MAEFHHRAVAQFEIRSPLGAAVRDLKKRLKEQGFVILSETNLRKLCQRKLGFTTFRNCVILNIYCPLLALESFLAAEPFGLIQPFNLVLSEERSGWTRLATPQPVWLSEFVGETLRPCFHQEVAERLERVIRPLSPVIGEEGPDREAS